MSDALTWILKKLTYRNQKAEQAEVLYDESSLAQSPNLEGCVIVLFGGNVDDKFTFAMLDWLTGRSLLALKRDGFHHLMMTCLFLLIGPRSGLVSKARIFWPGAFSILALSNKGGGEGSDPCQDFSGGIDLQYS